jgi:hypothetical protein
MVPEISEFSYGFALTNEISGWKKLHVAPVFPSLLEEGKAGGGYDVKMDFPGVPLFLQFKRSEWMTRKNARQYGEILASGMRISVPFYRFALMETWKSAQHEMLCELDVLPNLVYYAAPRFHKVDEINDAWVSGAVSARSVFISPSDIGLLPDEDTHFIAYDHASAFMCSEAYEVELLSVRQLAKKSMNVSTKKFRCALLLRTHC